MTNQKIDQDQVENYVPNADSMLSFFILLIGALPVLFSIFAITIKNVLDIIS